MVARRLRADSRHTSCPRRFARDQVVLSSTSHLAVRKGLCQRCHVIYIDSVSCFAHLCDMNRQLSDVRPCGLPPDSYRLCAIVSTYTGTMGLGRVPSTRDTLSSLSVLTIRRDADSVCNSAGRRPSTPLSEWKMLRRMQNASLPATLHPLWSVPGQLSAMS